MSIRLLSSLSAIVCLVLCANAASAKEQRICVAGFTADAAMDERDAWLPVAVEETLAWRLRRVPGVTVVPTIRAFQAHLGADSSADPDQTWQRIASRIGGEWLLTGIAHGTPPELRLSLVLRRVDGDDPGATTEIGPLSLEESLDKATRWVLAQWSIQQLDRAVEARIIRPLSRSRTALQYYAKAVSEGRAGDARGALYHLTQAVEYDRDCAPAQLMLAQAEVGLSQVARVDASLPRLRRVAAEAAQRGDDVSRADAENAIGVVLMSKQAYRAAQTQFENALARFEAAGDVYGRLAAMSNLADYHLSLPVGLLLEIPPPEQRAYEHEQLGLAIAWQRLITRDLKALGDRDALIPAMTKLALLYERLGASDRSRQIHEASLRLAEKLGDAQAQANVHQFLARWRRRNDDLAAARVHAARCAELANDQSRPGALLALGAIEVEAGDKSSAIQHYRAACRLLEDTNELNEQMRCLETIAQLHLDLGQRDAAIKAYGEARDFAYALQLDEERERLSRRIEAVRAGR